MTDLDNLAPHRGRSLQRPLLGMTVLVVEDSRYASEALRLMCLRSGARMRRADCLGSANRHLRVYRPSVVIVDPGLPDGSGLDLIAELDQATPRVGVILACSGDGATRTAAIEAGADGFLSKPIESLGIFQQEMLRHLPPERGPSGPYALNDEVITPDLLAYRDDLEHAQTLLSDGPETGTRRYLAQFLGGVARAAGDDMLAEATAGLEGHAAEAGIARVLHLIETRLAARVAL
ncbi:response regulator [Roseovarius tibetensis]|uniref:response regulator n=1 Tax=Roseovarius tibetensis TaxID=2685897 RepID=UPI003D7FF2B6